MFKKHTIENGSWKADVAPEIGANVIKLQYCGEDVFVPLTSQEQLDANPYIQGCPLLFPANRTANGRFSFGEREYTLPVTEPSTGANLHGLLHRQPFEVLEVKSDEITLRYQNNGEVFPFPFEICVNYHIVNDCFEQTYTIKNSGTTVMPFTFALHTSFVEPEVFSVPISSCQQKNEIHIPTGEYVPLDEQESRYVTGSASKGLPISGYYKANGGTAHVGDYDYVASEGFDHWILFNGAGKKGLLCVEPQCGAVNGLNTEDGCKRLAPGEEFTLWTRLKKATY